MRRSQNTAISLSALKEEISRKRKIMVKTAGCYGLESSHTLKVSRELDDLIALYLKSKLEEKKATH
ncbi:aspartyl-phosphate phosphatase Spo0E family protein [Salirhabdus salicampi]|uniref:aspartyl-phosphate phosphatase Spo0E family protein n=1 Tax=Salirhabdus salicampi TaxID=476102 RepID=UPI0020C1FF86|nr:aspartyl-phosphate phosphatase Spo0E family protein [Salirhabdus salicampi]MCP8616021.1 aspartyl-phosphate phosphatase Spo0E family protein [Salirhabdus salicampi]